MTNPTQPHMRASNATLFADVEFAEVEVGVDANKPATPAQPIGQRTIDPIREKFYQLRSLTADDPNDFSRAGVFYKQAKFMEDFADDYQGCAPFSMLYPCYKEMGYDQLRTYFTWRTNVRRGSAMPVSLSYVFLYVYELLNNVGVADPAEGLDKLMAIWKACRGSELDNYLPPWLKDYHVYYTLPHNFADFVNEHGLQKHYPKSFGSDTENGFAHWNNISSYDVTKSKFYNAGNDALFQDGFEAVLQNIHTLCANHGVTIEDIFMHRTGYVPSWYPFQRALFFDWLKQPDRRVEMPGRERYACNGGRWTLTIPLHYSDKKDFAGYLLKKTESCLRSAVKYKFKITADPNAASQSFRKMKELGITLKTLDATIEKAVADFYKDLTRTVVAVDHGNLARIRKEAQGTQEKLVVPEADASLAAHGEMRSPVGLLEGERPREPQQEDSWTALKNTLTTTERAALSLALRGANLKAFADEHNIMLEVLADSINEKAADFIGDNLLDEDMTIYDDYKTNVTEMVR